MSSKPPDLQSHPGVNDNQITWYVTERLRAGTINIYSAYLLMHEALRFKRLTYTQSAWGQNLTISGLLRIYFDYLTGTALGCEVEADESVEWFTNDIPLLREHRPHFLTDSLTRGADLLTDRQFYQTLSDRRHKSSKHTGPFPDEVFPYHFAAPERELLSRGSDRAFQPGFALDPESSDFYVQLQVNR